MNVHTIFSERSLAVIDNTDTKLSWSLQIVLVHTTVLQTEIPGTTSCISIIRDVYPVQIPRPTI